MKNTANENPVQLSKWWRTPSAQAAIERARLTRTEKLNQLRDKTAAKRTAIERDANTWSTQDA